MEMKKSITVIALFIVALSSFAQKTKEQDVPLTIKNAFHAKYPKAEKVTWDKEGDNYEASFNVNKIDNSVLLNTKGRIVETGIAIQTAQLPQKAVQYLNANFKNQKVKEAAKIVTANGAIIYEAEVGSNDLLFDESGNFIKKDKES